MTDIKTSIRLRQHEGWKETLEYIEKLERDNKELRTFLGLQTAFDPNDAKMNAARYDGYLDGIQVGMQGKERLEKALGVAKNNLKWIIAGKPDHSSILCAEEALKEISDIMGGG